MATIAITGPTGTFGHALRPVLEADDQVERVIGIARRPFDAAAAGWTKLVYRRGDVRDRHALSEAFEGADAVAHLAFARFGHSSRETLSAINIEGTMNAFGAAVDAGVRRFVFASSAAAYGFHADTPNPVGEDLPARGSRHWFYAREKAELDAMLLDDAARHPNIALTILRPTIVVGPYTAANIGEIVPAALRPLAGIAAGLRRAAHLPWPVVTFPNPFQFVHEEDVAEAFRLALLNGPAGIFNLAGDGEMPGAEVVRELGLIPIPIPAAAVRGMAAGLIRLPGRPAALEAVEAFTHPLLIDSSRARDELGWQPRYSSAEALHAAVASRSSSRA